jgi:hypothetical protein
MSAQGSPQASGPDPPHHASSGANPLRRTSDRVETWLSRFLLLVLLLGLPPAAIGAGRSAYESTLRTVHAQTAQRHEVNARLTAKSKGSTENATQRAQVRWTDDSGTSHVGTTLVKSSTPRGATVRIWVDRGGSLTGPPMSVHNALATGWLVGGMAALGVAGGCFAARAGMHTALDRRRYAQWDAEWRLVEPGWSARFRG